MMCERGDVWWGPALHKSAGTYRPWLVVNTASHPFDSEEAIVLAMTTSKRSEAIPVPADAWVTGGSDRNAFVSPWYPTTIKHRDFDDKQGALSASLVDRAVERLHQYLDPVSDR